MKQQRVILINFWEGEVPCNELSYFAEDAIFAFKVYRIRAYMWFWKYS